MPIPEPTFDARSYRDLVTETLARVQAHTPEWTNLNDSDPGVTLLQLFAFLGESIIYRANLIPERNRRKFLRLLRISPVPAEPARGLVAFSVSNGLAAGEKVVARDAQLHAGRLPFRTLNAVEVLPVETRVYYKRRIPKFDANDNIDPEYARIESIYKKLYASLERDGGTLQFYETAQLAEPESGVSLSSLPLSGEGAPMDGTLWLAVLAPDSDDPTSVRARLRGKTLSIGVMPAFGSDGCVERPLPVAATEAPERLRFEVPNLDAAPGYRSLRARSEVDVLARSGVVEVTLPSDSDVGYWDDLDPLTAGTDEYPPSIEDTDIQDRLVTWIRIRAAGLAEDDTSSQSDAKVAWVGVNAARVEQRARVPFERLPDGTGEPDQVATLANTPVILDESLRLTVNGEVWQRVDDLSTAPAEVPASLPRLSGDSNPGDVTDSAKVFTLDRESGELKFGDGARGMRPPAGAVVQIAYDYGGGEEGQVAIGSISRIGVDGVKVVNPVPTWGGSDPETTEDAERRIPSYLRHRDRLVSEDDFREIVERVPGVSIRRVEVLPVVKPELPLQVSEGSVTVLIVPASDPEHPNAPRPDSLVLETVCRYLAPRRLVTTELHVRGPEYVGIHVSVGIEVIAGADEPQVREEVEREIERFLSPLDGGFDGGGWALGKDVDPGEIAAAATRTPGVAKITGVLVSTGTIAAAAPISIRGLQLPELLAISVASGNPVGLDELVGEIVGGGSVDAGERVVPVPVVPEGC